MSPRGSHPFEQAELSRKHTLAPARESCKRPARRVAPLDRTKSILSRGCVPLRLPPPRHHAPYDGASLLALARAPSDAVDIYARMCLALLHDHLAQRPVDCRRLSMSPHEESRPSRHESKKGRRGQTSTCCFELAAILATSLFPTTACATLHRPPISLNLPPGRRLPSFPPLLFRTVVFRTWTATLACSRSRDSF